MVTRAATRVDSFEVSCDEESESRTTCRRFWSDGGKAARVDVRNGRRNARIEDTVARLGARLRSYSTSFRRLRNLICCCASVVAMGE